MSFKKLNRIEQFIIYCIIGVNLSALLPDEEHGFARPENRLMLYVEAEKFLAKYLGGRSEE